MSPQSYPIKWAWGVRIMHTSLKSQKSAAFMKSFTQMGMWNLFHFYKLGIPKKFVVCNIYYHASGFVCSFRQILGHSKLQLNVIFFPFLAYCAFALPTRPPLCQIIQSIVQLALLSLLVTPARVYLHIFRILCEL